MDYLIDSDEEEKSHISIPDPLQNQLVLNTQWFEKNINDKLE